jgi:hypothetical protein
LAARSLRDLDSASIARQDSTAQTVEAPGVVVTGEAIATPTPHDNFREMRQHIMPEVAGTKITVTKKATIIKLDQQPPLEDNDLQGLFLKAPGFLVTEQHTPGQFNFSYRGLGKDLQLSVDIHRGPCPHWEISHGWLVPP